MRFEGDVRGLICVGRENTETGFATHFASLDDRCGCKNDDAANEDILSFEVTSVVPSLQDAVANGTLQVRTDVLGEVSVDGDTVQLETTSDTP